MPHSLANVLIHIIFRTKTREILIPADQVRNLHAYIATVCRTHNCPAHAVGGTEDHVHIAASLARTVTISDLVRATKANSSRWLRGESAVSTAFAWQAGYGAFSIGESQLDALKGDIARQGEHHRRVTFRDEFLLFLERYKIDYDERDLHI
jgi:REP-associated tyrosine transposase